MVAPNQDYAIGIDLGGTNVKAVRIATDGTVLTQEEFPTDDSKGDVKWDDHIRDHLAKLEKSAGHPAKWVGLSSPGLAAPDGRTIQWMMGRMEAVMGLDWTKFLDRGQFVPVLNDAHAALIGESWQGAAKGTQNAILLTLGTGVGGAIFAEGRILKGQIGRAGHLGHICLNPDGPLDIVNTPGSLEWSIGNVTLPQRSGGKYTSTRELVDDHNRGNPEATKIWLRSVYELACGIVSLINAIDPERIILGGGVARAGDALFKPLAGYMDKVEWRPQDRRVKIVPAQLGDIAGAIGAAKNAIDHN